MADHEMRLTDEAASLNYVGPCPCCGDRLTAILPDNANGRLILRRLKQHARAELKKKAAGRTRSQRKKKAAK